MRQKTLFASTRLSLLRELGSEKFSDSFFATEKADLSPAGWEKWERHGEGEVPLTEEERVLGDVKRAEGEEGREMGGRKAHVAGQGMKVAMGEGVGRELGRMGRGEGGELVCLVCSFLSRSFTLMCGLG